MLFGFPFVVGTWEYQLLLAALVIGTKLALK